MQVQYEENQLLRSRGGVCLLTFLPSVYIWYGLTTSAATVGATRPLGLRDDRHGELLVLALGGVGGDLGHFALIKQEIHKYNL